MHEFVKVDKDYRKALRKEMEEFRALFNDWMKEIHAMEEEDYEDEWGLYLRNKFRKE
jgi:hypothetical protein